MTDTDRLDWLEAQTEKGRCPGLINDDNGNWSVSFEGMQNCPEGDGPCDISASFFVEAGEWYPSIREAIDAAIRDYGMECPGCGTRCSNPAKVGRKECYSCPDCELVFSF